MSRNIDKLTILNMDVYYPLKQKVELIYKISKKGLLFGKFLDLGCGRMPYKNIINKNGKIEKYVGIDIENEIYQKTIKPDKFWDGKSIPDENSYYDSSMLIEVLEHTPNPVEVLKEINRVLKKDGYLLITVPFLWTLHDVPNDEYRYTPFSLKRMLEESGFNIINLESFGGWHASMASMIALYIRRGYKGKFKKIFSKLLLYLIKYLNKKDSKTNKTKFHESQMITGLWCLAQKKND